MSCCSGNSGEVPHLRKDIQLSCPSGVRYSIPEYRLFIEQELLILLSSRAFFFVSVRAIFILITIFRSFPLKMLNCSFNYAADDITATWLSD